MTLRVPGLWVAVGSTVLLLCACQTTPRQTAGALPFDVPTGWEGAPGFSAAAPTATPALAQWWSQFNDPVLSRLVTEALDANTSVRGARAALQQARALRDLSAASLYPALGSSASAQRAKSGGQRAGNSFEVGLDASWELDVFGANRDALDSSAADAAASAASLGDTQVSIAAEVALNYIVLRNAQARLQIATSNLASQWQTLQITQWRLQAGLTTELEAEQARALVSQTHAQLSVLQIPIDQSRHALAVLTGQPPAALTAVLTAVAPVPQPDSILAISIPADTLRQRPDVRAAEFRVASAAALVAQADALRKPDFRLTGSIGLNALTLGGLSGGGAVFTTLLAGVSWPLFDAGAGRARVRVQQAALAQSQSGYAAAVLTALRDVEDALTALRNDQGRSDSLQQAAESAANAALLARQRYSSGLVDFQTVLETQRSQLSTQDSFAIARADVSTDHVRLYKALGGGWQAGAEDTPSPIVDTLP
jgi:outer membrane protein, multidrug efflux system